MNRNNHLALLFVSLAIFANCNDHSDPTAPVNQSSDTSGDPLEAAREYARNRQAGFEEELMSKEKAFDQFTRLVSVELPNSTKYLNGISYLTPGDTSDTVFLELSPNDLEELFEAVEKKWTDPLQPQLEFGKRKISVQPGSDAAKDPIWGSFGSNTLEMVLLNESPTGKFWIRLWGDIDTGFLMYSREAM